MNNSNNAIQVYVDSTYRLSGNTSSFRYDLKEPINAKSFKLTSAEIPLTFYNIRNISGAPDNNNIFYFSEDGTTVLNATISAGYYTSATIISALQTAMNGATTHAYTYTVSFNNTTQKFSIVSTGNWVAMYVNWLSVNWVIGYNANSTGLQATQVANGAPYLDYYQYFYLRLGISAQMCYDETGSVNRILKIPITNVAGSIQYYFDVSDNHFELKNSGSNIKGFDIQLLDSDYYPINLNGREYSFTLTFYY